MDLKKICSRCGIEKSIKEFHKKKSGIFGVRASCKECRKISEPYNKNYHKKYKKEHRKELKLKSKEYYIDNRTSCIESRKKYAAKTKIQKKEYDKKYVIKNKDRRNKKRRIWQNNKSKTDLNFLIKRRLQTRIYHALKDQNSEKKTSTIKYLDCSIQFFIEYIESLFIDNMSWDNYGEWHIDHIKPCALFDLTKIENQKKCFNYKNLQPLWAIDNILKGSKYVI